MPDLSSEAVSVDLRFVPNPSNVKLGINGKALKGADRSRTWVCYAPNVALPAGPRRAHVGAGQNVEVALTKPARRDTPEHTKRTGAPFWAPVLASKT
jgi:hypothetical protein